MGDEQQCLRTVAEGFEGRSYVTYHKRVRVVSDIISRSDSDYEISRLLTKSLISVFDKNKRPAILRLSAFECSTLAEHQVERCVPERIWSSSSPKQDHPRRYDVECCVGCWQSQPPPAHSDHAGLCEDSILYRLQHGFYSLQSAIYTFYIIAYLCIKVNRDYPIAAIL